MIDRLSDGILNTLRLEPGLTSCAFDTHIAGRVSHITVCTEEGIENTYLIKLHVHLISWSSVESRNISTAKYYTCQT